MSLRSPRLRPLPRARRLLASLVVGFAIAASLGATAGPAHAAPTTTTDPAAAAAGWLAGQLVDGERFETVFDGVAYPDHGLVLDAVIAFAAAGVAGDYADNALQWLATDAVIDSYLGHEFDSRFAGGYAKLAFTVQVYGLDPTSFGEINLISGLRELEHDGRFTDESAFGDYSNTFTQSFAILALARTTAGAPSTAVDFLLDEQCADGGFPLLFGQAECTGDVDATGMAVAALLAVEQPETIGGALDWLVTRQHTDGGFGGSPPTEEINANSTGLAAMALTAGGRTDAAARAVDYLRERQVDCDGSAQDRGGIAYDESGFDPATGVRSTSQATLGLAGVGLAGLDGTAAQPAAPVLDCDPAAAGPTASPTSPAGAAGELPNTGSPVLLLVSLGVAVTAVGAGALWATTRSRRRTGPLG